MQIRKYFCFRNFFTNRILCIDEKEAPRSLAIVLASPSEIEHEKKLKETITVPAGPIDLSPINGVPSYHVKFRRARISRPPKNAMQSGEHQLNIWQIQFDNRERWENPCMGWCSS